MYVDVENRFSDFQDVAAGASVSTGYIDLKRAGEDIGNGQPVYLVAVLTTDTGNDTGTYTAPDGQVDIEFVSATANDLTTGQAVHALLGSFPSGASEGDSICAALPATFGSAQEVQQFVGVQYQNAGAATPNIDCFLTTTPQKYKQYPKSYTISALT